MESQELKSVVNSTIDEIEKLIVNAFTDCPKISKGIKAIDHRYAENELKETIELGNFLLNQYSTLLSGKEISLQTYSEMIAINPHEIGDELRLKYLVHNGIDIPKFKAKNSTLVAAYNFEKEEETIINILTQGLPSLLSKKTLIPLWSNADKMFKVTELELQSIRDKFTLFATHDDIRTIIGMELSLVGINTFLNGASPESMGISSVEFCEFFNRKIRYNPKEQGFEIDFEAIQGEGVYSTDQLSAIPRKTRASIVDKLKTL